MTKAVPQITSEIATQLADNSIGAITPANVRQVTNDIINFAGFSVASVMAYASGTNIADGSTDCAPAFTAAFSAMGSIGGGWLFVPPGTYNFISGTLAPPNNVVVQGAGIDATILKCTGSFPNNVTIQIPMTLTGSPWPSGPTTYPINAPTLGATSVTTTVAGSASNFHANDIIFISGDTHGTSFWYPGWYTTVLSASGSTGVITLAETLPVGGSQLTTVQKIVSLPQNISVRDLTVISGSTAAIECQGGRNFVFENIKVIPGSGGVGTADVTFGIHRNSTFRHILMEQGANPIELFVSTDCTIEDCHLINSYILVDGGCIDCSVINNTVNDPRENNGTALVTFHGIDVPDYCTRIRIIGNKVVGIPTGFTGINTTDTPDANRYSVMIGNTLIGANTTSTVGLNTGKGVVVGNLFQNLQNGIQLESVSDTIFEGNYFDSTTTVPLSTFSGTGAFRTRQNPTLIAMTGGITSPTVQGGQAYTLTQVGGSQTVTGFTGGLPGDEITIIMEDNKTTFVHGGSSGPLIMKGATNYQPAQNVVMCFVNAASNVWNEKSRSA